MSKLIVKCPHCQTSFAYHSSEFRPFCSEKCRMIDLGQWLTESYTVPVQTHELTGSEQEELLKLQITKDEDDEET